MGWSASSWPRALLPFEKMSGLFISLSSSSRIIMRALLRPVISSGQVKVGFFLILKVSICVFMIVVLYLFYLF